ncbi:MAG: pyridoxamine 5'-phosphate oxidase family protein [Pseudomonadota bacterium]
MNLNDMTHESLLDDCWQRLEAGVAAAAHPWHTAVLGNCAGGRPQSRTVVVRAVDRRRRRIVCHTDARSPKCRAFAGAPAASWLLYDPDARIQLRLSGPVGVHTGDELADAQWRASRLGSRRCYLVTAPPGEIIDAPVSTLPEALRERRPEPGEVEAGRDNFAVLAGGIDTIDWLRLTSDGHRRARFRYEDGRWWADWVAP